MLVLPVLFYFLPFIAQCTCLKRPLNTLESPVELAEVEPFQSNGLVFCAQYSRSSCCSSRDEQKLYSYYGAKGLYETGFSAECEKITRSLMCSTCDPHVATGALNGICPDLCGNWYDACRNDYFEYDSLKHRIVPCAQSSLVCSPLHDILVRSDMCPSFGFSVSNADSDCFDGTPGFIQPTIQGSEIDYARLITTIVILGVVTLILIRGAFSDPLAQVTRDESGLGMELTPDEIRAARLCNLVPVSDDQMDNNTTQ